MRVIISESSENLDIVIPVKKDSFKIFSAIFASIIGFSILSLLVSTIYSHPEGFGFILQILFFPIFVALVVAVFVSIKFFLNSDFGKEIIKIDSNNLCIRDSSQGWGRLNKYTLRDVKNLRIVPKNSFDQQYALTVDRAKGFKGAVGGRLAFDYGTKKYKFAADIEDDEAKMIFQRIVSRFSVLASTTNF